MTKKFKQNLIYLVNLFENSKDLVDFLTKKKAFNEQFVMEITESDYLNKIKDFDKDLDVKEIRKRLHYEIIYNKKTKKISVDITKNDVFSYLDSEDELVEKMNNYILQEEYEKAQMLKNYFKTIDLKYE
ncbi:MAG: hypothetical protein HPY57_14585 [Ignavibacteria bacterium]|nr:hypothetical protein [Ignavibacteria bacterium]